MREDVGAKFPDEAESRGRGRRRRPGREPRVRHTRLSEAQRHAGSALIHTKTLPGGRAAPAVPAGRAPGAADPHEPTARTRQGWPPKVLPRASVRSHLSSPRRLYEADAESLGVDGHFLPRVK